MVVIKHASLFTSTLLSKVLAVSGRLGKAALAQLNGKLHGSLSSWLGPALHWALLSGCSRSACSIGSPSGDAFCLDSTPQVLSF